MELSHAQFYMGSLYQLELIHDGKNRPIDEFK